MKFISWNVNGIRAILQKEFIHSIQSLAPDVLCLQETKAERAQVNLDVNKLGFNYEYWNSADKKGYSGTAIFSKKEPLFVAYGLDLDAHDHEGRVITLEFQEFYLVNVYTPNSQRELTRLSYRQKEWDREFLKFVTSLDKNKPVIFCGDLNVAHQEIDLKNPASNRRNAGFTEEERAGMDAYLKHGFVDSFRYLYPDKIQYSWWSYMFQARANNVGWRIDYFLVSEKLKSKIKDAIIYDQTTGSDHCPIGLELIF